MEELRNDPEFVRLKNNEFYEQLPLDELVQKKSEDASQTPRRDFLKFLGFGVAAASLAACEAPVRKSIPYLMRPDQITPGIANWYASTYFDGHDYCSVLVKTRDGRPIKLEGNTSSTVTKGGVNARVQASVLSLYDSTRYTGPMSGGKSSDWTSVDGEISGKLAAIAAKGGKIRILSSTINSPSTLKVIADFGTKYPNTRHIQYDAVSYAAIRQSNLESFGSAVIPSYNFDKAEVIVSLACDFLVNWISPIEHSKQYSQTRKLDDGKKSMSRHIQFESTLSVTGSNADQRVAVKPSQQIALAASIYNAVAAKAGASAVSANLPAELQKSANAVAEELWNNKGKSLVVCGINDSAIQNLVNGINALLGNYGSTIDLDNSSNLRNGSDADMASLVDEMMKGEVSALVVYQSNPVYSHPKGAELAKAIKNIELTVALSDRPDETASLCQYNCPDLHPLESWNDFEPRRGSFSFAQPTIAPLFNARQAQESMMRWSGNSANYHDSLRAYWSGKASSWEKALQDGVVDNTAAAPQSYTCKADLAAAASTAKAGAGMELVIYEKTGLGNGFQANNPWLQELPDPITKITWDNYLTVSPADAREKGWKQGNVVSLKASGQTMNVPVVVQPGQAVGTVGLALGYGRTVAGKVADKRGLNAFTLVTSEGGMLGYQVSGISVDKTTEDDYVLAGTQTHHTMMGRAIVKETTLGSWQKNPNAGNPEELFAVHVGHEQSEKPAEEVSLWDEHEDGQYHWGMAIDLNSCTGCGSCVIACTAENNVAVVGKDEVNRSREMHWMRIDRYYSSDADPKEGEDGNLSLMEIPSENPRVVFQPVMCQHCAHAPCETVCPVIATSHSSEGLNQMTYNRCVGTRYCANNCPYKVRRFNWFKYSDNDMFAVNTSMNDDLGKMVLNPDVTVRARGVMEKCSMCVQRIQEGKLNAKRSGTPISDGQIQTACAQSCPTNAITFGDFKNKSSRLNKAWDPKGRSYHLLGELNVQPNVFYQTKVRNIEEKEA